jgi:hypothetical protein
MQTALRPFSWILTVHSPSCLGFLIGARSHHPYGMLSRGLQHSPHAPDLVCDLRCHHRRRAEEPVNPAEVVEREPEGLRVPRGSPFLREGIRQASESTRSHADAKVLAFDNRGAYAFRIKAAGASLEQRRQRG